MFKGGGEEYGWNGWGVSDSIIRLLVIRGVGSIFA